MRRPNGRERLLALSGNSSELQRCLPSTSWGHHYARAPTQLAVRRVRRVHIALGFCLIGRLGIPKTRAASEVRSMSLRARALRLTADRTRRILVSMSLVHSGLAVASCSIKAHAPSRHRGLDVTAGPARQMQPARRTLLCIHCPVLIPSIQNYPTVKRPA